MKSSLWRLEIPPDAALLLRRWRSGPALGQPGRLKRTQPPAGSVIPNKKAAPCQQPSWSQLELWFISVLICLMTVQPDRSRARKRHFTKQNHDITMPKFSPHPNSICCCLQTSRHKHSCSIFSPQKTLMSAIGAGSAEINICRAKAARCCVQVPSGSVCLSSVLFPGVEHSWALTDLSALEQHKLWELSE